MARDCSLCVVPYMYCFVLPCWICPYVASGAIIKSTLCGKISNGSADTRINTWMDNKQFLTKPCSEQTLLRPLSRPRIPTVRDVFLRFWKADPLGAVSNGILLLYHQVLWVCLIHSWHMFVSCLCGRWSVSGWISLSLVSICNNKITDCFNAIATVYREQKNGLSCLVLFYLALEE